ncbi:MAG: prolipoprotein diacylglyceryl transferase [Rhodospirillales bacterium]
MTFAIAFPNIDPVLIEIGPFVIRWYALAYIAGLLGGMYYMRALARQHPPMIGENDIMDFLVWATLGIIIGGRLGFVVFYQPLYFLDHPLAIFQVWKGGMSFHGGVIGIAVAALLFVRRRKISFLAFADLIACAGPIGLFLGRLANFVNGELFGRVTDVPWAMVFPRGGPLPRHPSQLYEAFLEGIVLFLVLFLLRQKESVRRRTGILSGVFLIGYAIARSTSELFREPDSQFGLLVGGTTWGQWLSLPMVLLGAYLILRARKRA